MRVVLLNTFEDKGGAARAAVRLFEGLRGLPELDARMLVREAGAGRPGVRVLPGLPTAWTARLDQRALKAAHPRRERIPFSVNRVPGLAAAALRGLRPDVAHLHWLHCGLTRIESLARLEVPVVWTIHDMWAFTGVCHYAGGCERYLHGCGSCPALRSENPGDVSARTFARKAAAWPRMNLTVVSPSRWLARLARKSPLLGGKRVEVIPNGLDTETFAPLSAAGRVLARQRLGLPADAERPLLLFGADFALRDARKGGGDLLAALARSGLQADLAIFGHDGPAPQVEGCRVHGLGYLRDDAHLAEVYAACDLYVLPTLQDNLPNTVLESLACGTPVLSYDVGGVPEMIEDGKNGFLVAGAAEMRGEERAEALARTLRAALTTLGAPERAAQLRAGAREKALGEYSLERTARRYAALYAELH
ncbi:glycosyltransferase [Paucidesulfovibrio longus]|uniref:glycosyltransferase n=1 Tax=Paucidesulfovibrio longus TaxID=889 RepID=UPI0003B35476|nr:glycosyltransferase [Paucidesulfovibrio longus]